MRIAVLGTVAVCSLGWLSGCAGEATNPTEFGVAAASTAGAAGEPPVAPGVSPADGVGGTTSADPAATGGSDPVGSGGASPGSGGSGGSASGGATGSDGTGGGASTGG